MATDRTELPTVSDLVPHARGKSKNSKPVCVRNDDMIGLMCESTEQGDAVHGKAIAVGATDEGALSPRGDEGTFNVGYFRDLDRNTFDFFNT